MPLLVPPEESSSELYALIRLLDDSDPEVTTAVQHRLIWHGARAVPYLRAAFANSKPKSPLALNAESCIRAIRTNALATLIDRIFDACAAIQTSHWKNRLRCSRYLDTPILSTMLYASSLIGCGSMQNEPCVR